MATYTELRGMYSDDTIRNKVSVAVTIAAHAIVVSATPTAAEKAWAASVVANPDTVGEQVYKLVLAANKNLTTAQISGATDAAIQAQVDIIVPVLIDALAGV